MSKGKEQPLDENPGRVDLIEARLAHLESVYRGYHTGKTAELEDRLNKLAIKQVSTLYEAERRLYGYRVHMSGSTIYGTYLHAFTLRGLRRRIERWERKQSRPRVKACRRV